MKNYPACQKFRSCFEFLPVTVYYIGSLLLVYEPFIDIFVESDQQVPSDHCDYAICVSFYGIYLTLLPLSGNLSSADNIQQKHLYFSLSMPAPSAGNHCKQFGSRSGRQYVGPDLVPNCLTLMVFMNCAFF